MEIPIWPASRPIALEDRALFQQRFAVLQPEVSELCFAGLYLFRTAHGYRVSRIGDSLIVQGHGYDGVPYVLPPLGDETPQALDRLFADGLALYGADDRFVQQYLADRSLIITTDRDNADYLYLRSDLAELPGSRYHKKRNRLAYFTRRHRYQVERYQLEHLEGCRALLARWGAQPRGDNNASPAFNAELAAADEALQMAEPLGLEGLVVLMEGRVCGFTLGERLNLTTAVCHFEKVDPYLEGLAQLINREFAAQLFVDCALINREQDLGEAGLRQAKSSYHPHQLLTKYRVRPAT